MSHDLVALSMINCVQFTVQISLYHIHHMLYVTALRLVLINNCRQVKANILNPSLHNERESKFVIFDRLGSLAKM